MPSDAVNCAGERLGHINNSSILSKRILHTISNHLLLIHRLHVYPKGSFYWLLGSGSVEGEKVCRQQLLGIMTINRREKHAAPRIKLSAVNLGV